MRVLTKNQFQDLWIRWTGDDASEVRHRFRVISAERLLPERSNPLADEDVSRIILAFLASNSHRDAAQAVREFSEFRCDSWMPGEEDVIANSNLLRAITIGLRKPYSINLLDVSPNIRQATLFVMKDNDQSSVRQYFFSAGKSLDLPRTTCPPIIRRSIYSNLTSLISELINDDPSQVIAGSENTKTDEVGASIGLCTLATQAANAKPAHTEQVQISETRFNVQGAHIAGRPFPDNKLERSYSEAYSP